MEKENYTFGLISLGCPKNLVDSEKISANLIENGHILCQDESRADILIINTCSFIASARDESLDVIRESLNFKQKRKIKAVIVVGCFAQQAGAKLFEEFEDIDAVISFSAYHRIADIIGRILLGERHILETGQDYEFASDSPRLILTGPYTAYLRISEGCSNKCTFCTIPSIRGPFRSKPEDVVIKEASELADAGIKELVLIGQDTTAYGTDLDKNTGLASLIEKIAAIKDIKWIRLMYSNPARITDQLIDVIAEIPNVVKYIDMPIQHVSDRVLKKMGRRHNEKQTRHIVEKLTKRVQGLVIRTSLLVGFPGESDEDFIRLLDFVMEGHFKRLGVFPYSSEENTPASRMNDTVAPEEAQRRCKEIMLAEQSMLFDFNKNLIGKRLESIVEIKNEDESYTGRTYMDAPEVDCCAFITGNNIQTGDIREMEVVDTSGYDLILESR